MKIVKAFILKADGADRVSLHTDLPAATFPYAEALTLEFEVARDNGETYVRTHFPDVPIEVLEHRPERTKFRKDA